MSILESLILNVDINKVNVSETCNRENQCDMFIHRLNFCRKDNDGKDVQQKGILGLIFLYTSKWA